MSPSLIAAGFVTVLVGFSSSAVIVFQAALAAGATTAELGSWIGALALGTGLTSIGLSLRFRAPVVTAWSTPGAALLAGGLGGYSMAEATGAFLISAVLIVTSGATGWFEKLMARVPMPLAAALLAGVLLPFGMNLFTALGEAPSLVLPMAGAYLAARRLCPRYAVIAVLVVGCAVAVATGGLRLDGLTVDTVTPVWTTPRFSAGAIIGIGVPLFIVTMASQNIPGVAVLRASGYRTPVSPLITWTGLATLALAPFGAFALNLAAITAAICAGREAHEDPDRRYLASVWSGIFYLGVALLGGTVAAFFAAFPAPLVAALAGLALIGTIASGLNVAMADEISREAALVTVLVAASGVTLLGVGSAFWALTAGLLTLGVVHGVRALLAPPAP